MASKKEELCEITESNFWQDAIVMWNFRGQSAFVDVFVVCGKVRLPSHRIILASSSSFFGRILEEDMHSHVNTLEVENVPWEVMECLLEYMYLGQVQVDNTAGPESAVDLVMAAHCLEVDGGSEYFCNVLLNRWFNQDLIPLWNWADDQDAENVEQTILTFLTSNLDAVCNQPAFGELSLQRIRKTMVAASMAPENYNEQMVRAIAAWVRVKSTEREEYVTKLMQHVKLAYVSKIAENDMAAGDEPSLMHYVMSESSTAVMPSIISGIELSPKKWCKKNAGEGVVRMQNLVSPPVIETKSLSLPDTNTPAAVKKIGKRAGVTPTVLRSVLINAKKQPIPFQEAFATFVDSKLLVVCKNCNDKLRLYCVQALTGWWSLPYDLNIMAKGKPTMVVYKQYRIYIFGCSEADPKKTRSDNTFVFDAKSMTLKQGLSLRWPRTHMAAAVYQDLIYLVGGLNRSGKVADNVETYNARFEQVENAARLMERRYEASCAVTNGKLYVFGGHTNRCECYDCRKEGGSTWSIIEPLPEFLNQIAPVVCTIDSVVYAFPRERAAKLLTYNGKRNSWRTTQTKHTSPYDLLDCAAADNKIFVLDGSGKLHLYDIKLGSWDEVYSKIEVERPLGLLSLNATV